MGRSTAAGLRHRGVLLAFVLGILAVAFVASSHRARALEPGDATLTIVKDTQPNDPQDFAFSVTGVGFSNFSLDDDGDEGNTLKSTAVFLFYGDALGTKTIAESPIRGWALSDLSCSEGLVVGATATVQVEAGDEITCTFTNIEAPDATLTIVKDAQPNDLQDFGFSVTGTGFSNFSLDDDGDETNTLKSTAVFLFYGDAFGTKTIAELPVAGWALVGLTCSEGLVVGATATVVVDPGDQITCTYTNTNQASLTIVKDALPDSPDDFPFTLQGGISGPFELDDDADGTLPSQLSMTILPVSLGAYVITEAAVAGWTLTDLVCTGAGADSSTSVAERKATLDVDAGENVVCTFTNTKVLPASLTIVKDANPNAPDDFGFTLQGVVAGPFELDDDADGSLSNTLTIVNGIQGFGGYTITEAALGGWALTDLQCTGDAEAQTNLQTRTATVDVDAGETIVCTFTNSRIPPASLRIIKVTDPASDPQAFDFDLTGQAVFADLDLDTDAGDATLPSQVTYPGSVGPQGPSDIIGAYTISESAQAGWELTGLECTGAGADSSTSLANRSATLDIDLGEEVVCTFTNTKDATLTIIKVTDPASDPQAFDFDLTGQAVFADLDLDTDAGDATLPSQVTYPGSVGPQGPSDIIGPYTITESALAGWELTGLECTGAGVDSSTSLANRSATLDIDLGEDVVCTFTNTKDTVEPSDIASDVPSPSPTQDQGDITSIPSQSDTFTEDGPDSTPRGIETLFLLVGLILALGIILLASPKKAPR